MQFHLHSRIREPRAAHLLTIQYVTCLAGARTCGCGRRLKKEGTTVRSGSMGVGARPPPEREMPPPPPCHEIGVTYDANVNEARSAYDIENRIVATGLAQHAIIRTTSGRGRR